MAANGILLAIVSGKIFKVLTTLDLFRFSTFGALLSPVRQVGLGIGLNMTGYLRNFVLVPKVEDRKRSI